MKDVLVFAGLPGTGKSTLAERMAEELTCPAFAMDWLLGSMVPSRVFDGVDEARVRTAARGLMAGLMSRQLILGQSAILDCVIDDKTAEALRERCKELGGRFHVFECICSDVSAHEKRVSGRVRGIPGWHEIDWQHVLRMRDAYPPLTAPHTTLDAVNSVDDNAETVLAASADAYSGGAPADSA